MSFARRWSQSRRGSDSLSFSRKGSLSSDIVGFMARRGSQANAKVGGESRFRRKGAAGADQPPEEEKKQRKPSSIFYQERTRTSDVEAAAVCSLPSMLSTCKAHAAQTTDL